MDEINNLRRKSVDIFSQRVTPVEKYKLEGDKTPEHEIKLIYLQKIIEKLRMNLENKYGFVPSSKKTFPLSKKDQQKDMESLIKIKEQEEKIYSSDILEDIRYEENINNSLDKK